MTNIHVCLKDPITSYSHMCAHTVTHTRRCIKTIIGMVLICCFYSFSGVLSSHTGIPSKPLQALEYYISATHLFIDVPRFGLTHCQTWHHLLYKMCLDILYVFFYLPRSGFELTISCLRVPSVATEPSRQFRMDM